MLFEGGEAMATKYGLRPSAPRPSSRLPIFRETYRRFRERLQQSQVQASLLTTTKWAIRDRSKFQELVAQIKGLVDDLESITSSAAQLQRRSNILALEIASISDEDSLRIIEEATMSSASQISNAASLRRLALQGTESIVSSHEQTFSTARTTAEDNNITNSNIAEGPACADEEEILRIPQNARIGQELAIRHRQMPSETITQNEQFPAQETTPRPVRIGPNVLYTLERLCFPGVRGQRVFRELVDLAGSPVEPGWQMGLSVFDVDSEDAICFFTGPTTGPYKEGIFYVRVHYGLEYPFKPPVFQLLTRIYHPNIDGLGRICLDVLYDQFSPMLTVSSLLVSVVAILDEPNAEDPLVPEIAAQFVRDRRRYDEIARSYTFRYATGELPTVSPTGPDGRPWWESAKISSGL